MIRVLLTCPMVDGTVVWMPNVPHTDEYLHMGARYFRVTKVIHQVVYHEGDPVAQVDLTPVSDEEALS